MNIILVIIDTLRYDFVGANGNQGIDTPSLDHLAAESTAFNRAFAASFPTIPFRTDVMTGRTGDPFHVWKPLRHSDWTLVEALKHEGYATQLIHDTPHLVNGGHNFDWPFHAWSFIRGAEVDRAWIDDDVTWLPNWKTDPLFDCLRGDASAQFRTHARTNRNRERDEDWNCAKLFNAAARFLEDNRRREKFFLWLDCFDPHEPWDAPLEFTARYDPRPDADGTFDPRLFQHRQIERSEEAVAVTSSPSSPPSGNSNGSPIRPTACSATPAPSMTSLPTTPMSSLACTPPVLPKWGDGMLTRSLSSGSSQELWVNLRRTSLFLMAVPYQRVILSTGIGTLRPDRASYHVLNRTSRKQSCREKALRLRR